MRHKLKIILLIMAFCVTGLSGLSVCAQGLPVSGLDVVLVIDQSGSMWGSGPSFTKNDKWGHRIGQAKNIIYRLAEHAEETSFIHRVIVVDFGDDAHLAAPSPLLIKYDPKDPTALQSVAKTWAEQYVTAKDLINTNTPAGMELGLNELKKLDSSGGLINRRKVMLLLTDGRPDLGRGRETLDGLHEQIESVAAKLKENNVELWIVGLNDASNYWNEGDGEFWQQVAGRNRARLAETTSTNIGTLVQDIVNDWLGVTSTTIDKEYDCPPYLRRIIFNINFNSPRSSVTITSPEGNSVPLSSGGSASSPGTFARFIVDNPKAGTYKLDEDLSRGYTNQVELFSPNIQRLKPLKKTGMTAESQILFQVIDGTGVPLQLQPEWPLKAFILATPPTGAQIQIPATYAGDGKFEASWKPSMLGQYRLRLQGFVALKNGTEIDVFGSNGLAYDENLEVDDSQPYSLELTKPAAADIRIFPWQDKIDIEFSLVDPKKEKVSDPSSIVKDPVTWLGIQLVDKSGVPVAATQPLSMTSEGVFKASLPVSLRWRNGEGLLTPGRMDWRIVAQPDRLSGKNYLDSVALPSSDNHRINSDPLTISNVNVRYSWVFLGPLLFIVVGIPIFGAALAFRRLIPNTMVWWMDSSRRRTVELKIYDSNEDPNGDFAKKLQITSFWYFNGDRSISLQIDGEEIVARKFRVTRDLTADVVSVRIEYSWSSMPDKAYTIKVTKGRPQRLKDLPKGDFMVALDVKSGA